MTVIEHSGIKAAVLEKLSDSKQCIPLRLLFNGARAFHCKLSRSTRQQGILDSRSRTVLKRMQISLGLEKHFREQVNFFSLTGRLEELRINGIRSCDKVRMCT